MLSITKIFTFEAAHRISDYQGACNQLHGHSYKLHVTVSSKELGGDDMLMDFKILKRIIKEHVLESLDHTLILRNSTSNQALFCNYKGPVFWMEYEPTAERMLEWMALKISSVLPSPVYLKKLRLYETETCYAEWEK